MIILGLNCFHGDSAAALIHDGKLIPAAEEERFRRVRYWAGFPLQAITFCAGRGRHHAVRRRSRRDQSGWPRQFCG
jgi:predicted NodU family carbamoyl transferase